MPTLLAAALLVASGARAQDHAHGHGHGEAHRPPSSAASDGVSAHRHHPPTERGHEGQGAHRVPTGAASLRAGADHAGHSDKTAQGAPAHDPAQSHGATPASTHPPAHNHSEMDHSGRGAANGHPTARTDSHVGHAPTPGDLAPDAPPRTPIPTLTDADRTAAFPSLHPHAMGDSAIRHFVRVDRLEGFDTDHGHGLGWEVDSWIGGDVHRLWLKSGGERVAGRTHDASLDALYGRSVSPWWDVVAGAHHVFAPGQAKTYASVGVQGLAPYFFEVSAMAHVDDRGRVLAELEIEYELLLTNRLILQPAVELSAASESDSARRIGSGLGRIEAGLRLRYEVTRRFAPYIGVVHERSFGQTRILEQADGGTGRETRWVVGIRTWF
ncbi:hypothetical protein BEN78_14835 [Xanthomonas citri pv. mangiferaeindicae]|nr:hypothetical protein BEN78_14835 [Xanthomonas citri pv. mangiferaeindicae]